MPLNPKDLEEIQRIVYASSGDIAVGLGRSFERLEERVDAAESRIHSRLSEMEDELHATPVGSAV